MDRLTRRDEFDNAYTFDSIKAIQRLAEYEDLEESGRLVKLPCAVGDTVYIIEADEENFDHFYCPKKVSEVEFSLDLLYYWGNAAFLTREAAEAKLKEMEDKYGKDD